MYGHIVWRIFTDVSVDYAASVTVIRPRQVLTLITLRTVRLQLKYRLIIFKFKSHYDSA